MSRPDSPDGPPLRPVAAGSVVGSDPPVHRRRVFLQVMAGAAVVIAAVALIGVVAARRLAEAEAVNDAAKTADLFADSVVQPVLTDALATGDDAAVSALDRVVRDHVLDASVVRVKVWSPAGRILYSDEPRLIGAEFPLGADEREVLSDPRTRADVSDLSGPENLYERDSGKLLEVYRPVWTPSGRPLLFETYFRYDDVTARSGQLWRGFAGVTLSSILLLVVLLMPILWRLLDRLRRAQDHREALLEKAIQASSDERRRIAGTLHDGPVQDLAATSFAVAGAAERAGSLGEPILAAELRAAAATVRTSIGGLRSLLVDIYPPSLETAGLPAALTDLATGLRSRGIEVDLRVAQDIGLTPEAQRLVFRVAHECLNNVVRHAAARHVQVRLEHEGDDAVLDIADDGVGFDDLAALAGPAEGHFGLRVLVDVVADSDATLLLATAPGRGTRWQLRVPR